MLKIPTLLYALITVIGFGFDSAWAQVIEGKVDLPAAAPETAGNQRYATSGDATAADPELPTAVVFLEGNFLTTEETKERPVVHMAQKNISFAPGLLAVQVGTAVSFPNLDDTYHNVFSYSKAKRFDLGRYRKDEKPGVVLFDKPGVVTLHCEVHEKMRGTVLVLDTPYFQKTDTEGHYRLSRLPVGHYLLKAWVAENDVRVQSVDLREGSQLRVDFPRK